MADAVQASPAEGPPQASSSSPEHLRPGYNVPTRTALREAEALAHETLAAAAESRLLFVAGTGQAGPEELVAELSWAGRVASAVPLTWPDGTARGLAIVSFDRADAVQALLSRCSNRPDQVCQARYQLANGAQSACSLIARAFGPDVLRALLKSEVVLGLREEAKRLPTAGAGGGGNARAPAAPTPPAVRTPSAPPPPSQPHPSSVTQAAPPASGAAGSGEAQPSLPAPALRDAHHFPALPPQRASAGAPPDGTGGGAGAPAASQGGRGRRCRGWRC